MRAQITYDAQNLGRQTDGALDLQLLVLGAVDQVRAHCRESLANTRMHCERTLLQVLDVLARQGDADTVNLGIDLFFKARLGSGSGFRGGVAHFEVLLDVTKRQR